ncbi:hypothetical protein QEH59_17910 [Coraliomargarita sp. SDUM461004]|uniref:PEP-CTERM sorting domain-containing protein n=1 Tax=Thalassobacterium sedimentorum TaxID=3041258 RepID=A0ABU1ANF2_9BACT|nr:hypothetical protein [Coraliomargarita sp. SDUM461004]MDQ8196316.1 hypothetical protein [Coraliomargarita sp. SDUM461004]
MLPCLASIAHSAIFLNLYEAGADVVLSASGSANTSDLTVMNGSGESYLYAPAAVLQTVNRCYEFYSGVSFSGPTSFTGTADMAGTFVSGDAVDIIGQNEQIILPTGYISGSAVSGESIWAGVTLASMGLDEGTYTWTWGNDLTADSLTLIVSQSPIPEPSSYSVIMSLIVATICLSSRRRRKA